jgi:DegV family protein with EDD domain
MNIAIITDSAADLPAELIYKYNVRIIPSRIIIDGKIRYDNGVDINNEDFYADYCNSNSTSQITTEPPSVDEILQVYKRLCIEYDAILSIHVAGRLSETLKNARKAVLKGMPVFKRMRLQHNLGRPLQIRIIDSQNVSLGLGLLVIRAAEFVRQGISFSKLANELEKLAEQIYTFFVVEDPKNLRIKREWVKVSFLDAQIARGLSLKPILKCFRGEITVADRKKQFEKAVEHAMNLTIDQLHMQHSYDKIGVVFNGPLSEMANNEKIINYRHELATMGLGSIAAVASPSIGYYTGGKSIGLSLINGDIKLQDILNTTKLAGKSPLSSLSL